MTKTISTRVPIGRDGTTLIVLALGSAVAEFGDEVRVESGFDNKLYGERYVAGVDTAAIRDLAPEVTALLGIEKWQFHSRLELFYKTGLSFDQEVTIYTLYDRPVEETA